VKKGTDPDRQPSRTRATVRPNQHLPRGHLFDIVSQPLFGLVEVALGARRRPRRGRRSAAAGPGRPRGRCPKGRARLLPSRKLSSNSGSAPGRIDPKCLLRQSLVPRPQPPVSALFANHQPRTFVQRGPSPCSQCLSGLTCLANGYGTPTRRVSEGLRPSLADAAGWCACARFHSRRAKTSGARRRGRQSL
jgi:hypothetical protein